MVNQMRKMGNLDPSRSVGNDGNDRRADGRDDPVALRCSADDDDWRPMLLAPCLTAALSAAVTLTAITASANPEHRLAIGVAAKPLPENNFRMNRHPRA